MKEMADVMKKAWSSHPVLSLLTYSLLYLVKQSFGIPGSVLLNLMAGAFMSSWLAWPLCCLLAAAGASACFLVSGNVARELLMPLVGKRLLSFRNRVDAARREKKLLWYLLFLRAFPFTPNWLVNLASPWVGVPLRPFFLSVLLGLAPYNLVTVRAGRLLLTLSSASDALSWTNMGQLLIIALLALAPALLQSKAAALLPMTRVPASGRRVIVGKLA
eukprot:PLAT14051.3.p1 GENE.PLAT14051.3~~PLAT14051.3.p1  ORF type:complete len:217 (+),score=65.21 PLAT14051.3:347-997(+)